MVKITYEITDVQDSKLRKAFFEMPIADQIKVFNMGDKRIILEKNILLTIDGSISFEDHNLRSILENNWEYILANLVQNDYTENLKFVERIIDSAINYVYSICPIKNKEDITDYLTLNFTYALLLYKDWRVLSRDYIYFKKTKLYEHTKRILENWD